MLLATAGCEATAVRLFRSEQPSQKADRQAAAQRRVVVEPASEVLLAASNQPPTAGLALEPVVLMPPVDIALVSGTGQPIPGTGVPVPGTELSVSPTGQSVPETGIPPAGSSEAPPMPTRLPPTGARNDAVVTEQAPLPEPTTLLPEPIGTRPAGAVPPEPLPLEAVIESVYRSFPEIAEAAALQATARGEEQAAWGRFDTVLEAATINQPLDFYENYRHSVGVTRPVWSGGSVSAGYRIGRGKFEPWYEERNTNDGGEFRLSFETPLAQGRAIDPRRVAVRTANLRRQATDPEFRAAVLEAQRAAARAYWAWVQAGFAVEVQRQVLELGRQRVRQIEAQIAAGELGKIAALDNSRFIAQREAALIQAEREVQLAAVSLSIYLRDFEGMPVVAPLDWLPNEFPPLTAPQREVLADGVARASLGRPEPQALQLEAAALRVELSGAANQTLPEVDAAIEASQDVGGAAKAIDDKGEFKLIAGLQGTLPVQRRAARGRISALQGRQRQNLAQLQLLQDRIAAEAQNAAARLTAAWEQHERAEENQRLATQALELGRVAFDEGDIDLLLLNIYEQSVADAQVQVYTAKAAYFAAWSDFRIAIGDGVSAQMDTPQ